MQKHRYIFCLFACGFLLYYAVPRLSITASGAPGIFSASWLILALFVAAGNLTGLLYFPKSQRQRKTKRRYDHYGKKSRSYH